MDVTQIWSNYVYWLKWPTRRRAEGLSLVHPEPLTSFTGLRHCANMQTNTLLEKKRAVF